MEQYIRKYVNNIKIKRILTRAVIIMMIPLIACEYISSSSYAEANRELSGGRRPKLIETKHIKVYKELSKKGINTTEGIIKSTFRYFGFEVIKILAKAVDGLYSALGEVLNILSFGYSKEISKISSKYQTLYKILFIITLTLFGLYLILGHSNQNQLNTVNCVIAMIIIITAYPLMTQKLGALTVNASNYARSQWVETKGDYKLDSIAVNVIKKKTYDLYKMDKNKMSGESISVPKTGYNNINNKDDYLEIDINEPLNPDTYDLKNSDIWENELVKINDKYETRELKNVIMPNTYYYRYQINDWLYIFVTLITTVITLALLLFRVAGMIIEIAFSQVYMPFIAVTDIASGQRIKEAVKGVISFFAAIFFAVALFGVFLAGLTYISTGIKNTYLGYMFLIALAWASINGSVLLERIIGVDVGMRSGWSMVAGAMAMGKATSSAARRAGRSVKGVVKGGVSARRTMSKLKDKVGSKSEEGVSDKIKTEGNKGKGTELGKGRQSLDNDESENKKSDDAIKRGDSSEENKERVGSNIGRDNNRKNDDNNKSEFNETSNIKRHPESANGSIKENKRSTVENDRFSNMSSRKADRINKSLKKSEINNKNDIFRGNNEKKR